MLKFSCQFLCLAVILPLQVSIRDGCTQYPLPRQALQGLYAVENLQSRFLAVCSRNMVFSSMKDLGSLAHDEVTGACHAGAVAI